ncbi:MAG: valine--tRNA ligase [Rhodospirillales bacterium]|jgi:valyl-tRNA synthetase|nr:valine--tRNA ligase [Rhodospirillales bacterium]
MLDKTYRPVAVEERIYSRWEDAGAFACGRSPDARPYTIVIPPPNVTGSLHIGHALNNTLQDILVRFERMRGRDVLWQPGTDHAGIATQMVVERQLEGEGTDRHQLGREAFVERVWKWKAESGDTITRQLRRLGASCDWSRERFTLDDGLSAAVRKVFVDLYKQGLIYKDKRLVNWDPKLHTAISDLEVEQRETTGKLWYFRYPIEGRDGESITVATTRPETMLGDTAIAVHPEDDRYRDLVGQHCILPIVGRRLIIVADEYADPEKGSGAVKMTPAHDFNDFEVGRRHDLELVNIFDRDAQLNDKVPKVYRGLDRFVARDRVIAEMESLGLLEKIEENLMTVPYGDRSGVVIEPWLTDQWFADAATLAKPAIEAVESGRTQFVPRNWENTYFEWMRNIQPWCISRQLWWGHQVPAWYGPDGTIFVEMSEEEARAAADKHYGETVALEREEDVLDTWFSSALWPFSTLGWPETTPEVDRYFPTDVLVTSFDIIFFWVARMMMMGLHFMDEVPFHTVYIHALVRDEKGQKMSKSKGNVMDPLDLFEKYGTDAVRFTLAILAAQGRDVRLAENRIEGYRNFVTKLWNAARFCLMNGCTPDDGFDPNTCSETVNRWIVGKVAETTDEVVKALEAYRFNEAAGALYHFVWGTFCDWYLEFTKPILTGDDARAAAETRAATAWALDRILRLLHPFMPYVTEELWAETADERPGLLVLADWPQHDGAHFDGEAEAEMDWVVRLVTQVRSIRSEMHVPPGQTIPLTLRNAGPKSQSRLARHGDLIVRLARLSSAEAADGEVPKGSIQDVLDEATIILPLAGIIDIAGERARLKKEIAKLDGEVGKLDKKLANQGFLAKAPAEVVEEQRRRLADTAAARTKLDEALIRLAAL